jgi:hypothetical protein
MFEVLQLLKSGYCQGHTSAMAQAEFAAAHEYPVVEMVWLLIHVKFFMYFLQIFGIYM